MKFSFKKTKQFFLVEGVYYAADKNHRVLMTVDYTQDTSIHHITRDGLKKQNTVLSKELSVLARKMLKKEKQTKI